MPVMHNVAHTRSDGVTVQISQSVHTCVSPGSGSENGDVSMCTSAALTIFPSKPGSVTVGVFGRLAHRADSVAAKAMRTAPNEAMRRARILFSPLVSRDGARHVPGRRMLALGIGRVNRMHAGA